jgi:hypothetical protein
MVKASVLPENETDVREYLERNGELALMCPSSAYATAQASEYT